MLIMVLVMDRFGPYLRSLRRTRGLSLKQVEAAAGVSNAYLSLLERGQRNPPHPEILKRLAKCYEVPHRDLLMAAGYLEDELGRGVTRDQIDQAYTHVISDPRYRHGTRLKGSQLSLEAKRFIIEMYENITGHKLLQSG